MGGRGDGSRDSSAFPGVSLHVFSGQCILCSVPRMESLKCKSDHVGCLLGKLQAPYYSSPTLPTLPTWYGSIHVWRRKPWTAGSLTHHTPHFVCSWTWFQLPFFMVPSMPLSSGATIKEASMVHMTLPWDAPAGCSHGTKIYLVPAWELKWSIHLSGPNPGLLRAKMTSHSPLYVQHRTHHVFSFKSSALGTPGWLSSWVSALISGRDPRVLGLSLTSGSPQGACFSLCLCPCLSLCVSHE